MKTNAIVRIVIWSIVILFLTGILLSGAFGWNLNSRYRSHAANTDTGTPIHQVGSVTDAVNIRTAPTLDAQTAAILSPGDTVEITRTETVNGMQWHYVVSPVTGWVLAEAIADPSVEISDTLPQVFQVDASQIRSIEIEWAAGDISIVTREGIDQIRFSEAAPPNSRYRITWEAKGEELSIRFCDQPITFSGLTVTSDMKKDLTIEVPADWVCQELELDVAAVDLTVQDLMIRDVDFDGASGTCDFQDCIIGDLDLDAASGDVRFSGQLENLDFDAASASFTGVFTNTPRSMDVDGMSGTMDLTLPEDGGYSVSVDGLSSSFTAESHICEVRDNMNVYGDGSCRIQVDGMSCSVTIRLGSNSAGGIMP